MESGTLHRLIRVVRKALTELGHPLPLPALEPTCVIIHRIMNYQTRQFHTIRHVFGFLDSDTDAHTALAAVFHDLVYFQVDDGIPPVLHDLCYEYILLKEGQVFLRTDHPSDQLFGLCLQIFGFAEGQALHILGGLNEFLSALLFLRMMGDTLPTRDLVAVAVCIEASIPFRGVNSSGRQVHEELSLRLATLQGLGSGLTSAEIHAFVARAIGFANRDVNDFQLPEPGVFLNNTWKLMPETNPALRFPGTFTVKEYRVALTKMLGFFRYLKPENIFHWAPGLKLDLDGMTARARNNLAIAMGYLEAKLLAVSLLEALALVTGGDAPLSLFMGDIAHGDEEFATIEKFLPPAGRPAWLDVTHPVFHLLAVGRVEESNFDLKNSPLAEFLYVSLEPEAREKLLPRMN